MYPFIGNPLNFGAQRFLTQPFQPPVTGNQLLGMYGNQSAPITPRAVNRFVPQRIATPQPGLLATPNPSNQNLTPQRKFGGGRANDSGFGRGIGRAGVGRGFSGHGAMGPGGRSSRDMAGMNRGRGF